MKSLKMNVQKDETIRIEEEKNIKELNMNNKRKESACHCRFALVHATEIPELFSVRRTSLYFGVFLNFRTSEFETMEIEDEYRHFKRSNYYIPLIIVAIILMIGLLGARGNISQMFFITAINPLYGVGFIMGIIASLALTVLVFNLVAIKSYEYNLSVMQPYYQTALNYSNNQSGKYLESFIIICIAVSISMYSLARIWSGQVSTCRPIYI